MAVRRYAARVVVLDPLDRVLLFNWANRRKGTDWWATPGGGLEEGESSEAAGRRELLEETGITADALEGPLWRGSHFFRSGEDLVHQFETFFLARVSSAAVDTRGFDAFEAAIALGHRWWTVDELEASEEEIYPRGLGGLVRGLVRDGVPAKAVTIRG
ncbi:MAG: NUDIX hydrolase [Candidatus Dormibacteria bacterium]